jgi:hypothetical protein
MNRFQTIFEEEGFQDWNPEQSLGSQSVFSVGGVPSMLRVESRNFYLKLNDVEEAIGRFDKFWGSKAKPAGRPFRLSELYDMTPLTKTDYVIKFDILPKSAEIGQGMIELYAAYGESTMAYSDEEYTVNLMDNQWDFY